MSENKANLVQTSFRCPKSLKNAFMGKVKGAGLEAQHVLTELVQDYVGSPAITENEKRAVKPLDEHPPGSDMISVAGLSKRHRRYLETIAEGLRNKDVGVIGAAETAARMWEQAQALITKESDAQEETAEKGRRAAGTRG